MCATLDSRVAGSCRSSPPFLPWPHADYYHYLHNVYLSVMFFAGNSFQVTTTHSRTHTLMHITREAPYVTIRVLTNQLERHKHVVQVQPPAMHLAQGQTLTATLLHNVFTARTPNLTMTSTRRRRVLNISFRVCSLECKCLIIKKVLLE